MESIIRAVITYFFVLIIFRLSGKRTLKESTPFDFILLLVIGGATKDALIDEDLSITNSFLVIGTLVFIDIMLSIVSKRSKKARKYLEGVPVLLVSHGNIIEDHAKKSRVDRNSIMEAARAEGVESLEQIKYAVLEKNGDISIIAKNKE